MCFHGEIGEVLTRYPAYLELYVVKTLVSCSTLCNWFSHSRSDNLFTFYCQEESESASGDTADGKADTISETSSTSGISSISAASKVWKSFSKIPELFHALKMSFLARLYEVQGELL